ncbi:MAG: TIGR04053 family radical SAM/SPASM domain-containing protein [Luteitalea sp.]|nr:TIGR04053 family radical SAM/SPASM domain-containing protein [Luteitalea sp.]
MMASLDFDRAPFLVIWEVTRACALACLHCRADAIPRRDPRELTTDEGFRLIDEVRSFGDPAPLFVLTGGDPMRRPDLVNLVNYASRAGLTVAITPSGTAAVTRKRLLELRDAGLSRIAVSLDGPDPASHDTFRGVRGSYHWTMRIIEAVTELGIPLQINTTVSRLTLPLLRAMAERVATYPLVLWAVFFLVQTGRGASLEPITAQECEEVLNFLYELSLTVPFGIKTTEAPHYHRVVWQRQQERRRSVDPGIRVEPGQQLRAPHNVSDGNGVVFVDHLGQIYPSGFLPIVRGAVRHDSLVSVYRDDTLFRQLRDPNALEGKCGRCEFRATCGGSRSRAYAAGGAVLSADALCAYEPLLELE